MTTTLCALVDCRCFTRLAVTGACCTERQCTGLASSNYDSLLKLYFVTFAVY